MVWLLRFLLYSISGDFMCTFSILSSRHHLFFFSVSSPLCLYRLLLLWVHGGILFPRFFFSPAVSVSLCHRSHHRLVLFFYPKTEGTHVHHLPCLYLLVPLFFLHLAIPVLPYPIPPYMYHLSIISSAICRSFLCPERKPGYAPSHPTRNMINVSDGLSLICSDT